MANNPPRKNKQDIEELENSFRNLSGKNNKKSNAAKSHSKKGMTTTIILIVCICLLSVAAVA